MYTRANAVTLFISRYLYDMYDYERAHEELEDRSTLKYSPAPARPSRSSLRRSTWNSACTDLFLHVPVHFSFSYLKLFMIFTHSFFYWIYNSQFFRSIFRV